MRDSHTRGDRCSLCGSSVGANTETATAQFCSSGCRTIADTLEPVADDETERDDSGDDGGSQTFLRIDGMHAETCESYLERVAMSQEGVTDVAASYVTESVRVEHDPDRISSAELRDALSTLGYTAYCRDEATADRDRSGWTPADRDDSAGATRRDREMTGMRRRRSEDLLEIRYIVGVVFGSFLLVPYVAIFYPVYLATFTEWWMLHLYEDAFTNLQGFLLAPIFVVVTGIVLYLTGMPLLRGAYVSLKLRRPNTGLLATLTIVSAFCYGSLAFVVGRNDVYYDLTILVAALVMAAVFYEAMIKRRAMNRLTDLTVSQVDNARLLDDGTTTEVPVAELEAGDRVLVRDGERIPIDGVLAEGSCTVDESVVTGDSLPVRKQPGDEVVGGSIVTTDAAIVAVGDRTTSSIDRLLETVWNVQSATHGGQRRGDSLAVAALPIVVGAAVVVGVAQLATDATMDETLLAVLAAILVTSPWALALATRVSVGQHLQQALDHGIVVFDESVFERIRNVDTVVFDKTGTLTTGEMSVIETHAPDELVIAAGALEQRSSHPVAAAVASAAVDTDDDAPAPPQPDGGQVDRELTHDVDVREFRSHDTGVEGVVDGDRLLVGHPTLLTDRGWEIEPTIDEQVADARTAGQLPVVVGRNGRAEGVIVVGDEPRTEWVDTVATLHERGIETVVLTGDDRAATDLFREHPHVDRVFAAVPPAGKTAAIRRLSATGVVAMIGDGTNDAPALAAADLGLSLGGGTALAADAADVAIVDDDLGAIDRSFALATAAGHRLKQSLGLAFVYNAIVIPIAIAGLLNPLATTVALVVCTLAIVGNASRPLLPET